MKVLTKASYSPDVSARERENLQVAYQAACEGMVLLKNEGILLLDPKKKEKIAVIGPNADDYWAQYGDWTYFPHPKLNMEHAPIRPYVTVKEGMEAACAARGIECVYHRGCSVLDGEYEDIAGAVELARCHQHGGFGFRGDGKCFFFASQRKNRTLSGIRTGGLTAAHGHRPLNAARFPA